jgi:hypothetical protein
VGEHAEWVQCVLEFKHGVGMGFPWAGDPRTSTTEQNHQAH